MIHRVVVYLAPGNVIAHVQSTNGDDWPRPITETDENGLDVPLTRIELELEPTPEEVAAGENGRPAHRSASVLFNTELEISGGKIRYRADSGQAGAITERARLPG